MADEEAIRQIVDNLIDNAIKYTPEKGSVRVRCHSRRRFVAIEVADTGIGIPRDDLPRIFERFYRVDKARSRELGGTGLGLSIVKHLVQSIGGQVNVNSRVGSGTQFTVHVPRCRPDRHETLQCHEVDHGWWRVITDGYLGPSEDSHRAFTKSSSRSNTLGLLLWWNHRSPHRKRRRVVDMTGERSGSPGLTLSGALPSFGASNLGILGKTTHESRADLDGRDRRGLPARHVRRLRRAAGLRERD